VREGEEERAGVKKKKQPICFFRPRAEIENRAFFSGVFRFWNAENADGRTTDSPRRSRLSPSLALLAPTEPCARSVRNVRRKIGGSVPGSSVGEKRSFRRPMEDVAAGDRDLSRAKKARSFVIVAAKRSRVQTLLLFSNGLRKPRFDD
jgi:hypothetical protein